MPVFSFKGITHAYLLKTSKTHNKKRFAFLNLLINCMSAKWSSETLSIKDECAFCVLNFLIISLCSSSDNTWFDIIRILT